MSTRSQLTKDLNGKWEKRENGVYIQERLGVAIICFDFFFGVCDDSTSNKTSPFNLNLKS